MVDAALENTASMAMGTDSQGMGANCIEDELRILGAKVIEALLDDMVAIQVLDETYNILLESTHDGSDLSLSVNMLNHLLKCASSMLVDGNVGHMRSCVGDEGAALFRSALLKKLLAEIVAERIFHELDNMVLDFIEDNGQILGLLFSRKGIIWIINLLLQEAATILILGHLKDLANVLLNGVTSEAILATGGIWNMLELNLNIK